MGGGQVMAIPFTAIDRYAARVGIDDPDEFALLARLIGEMDAEYLSFVNAKRDG